MFIDAAARGCKAGIPAGSHELAEGLMLLRASTLKIIRLQLALQREDRHVALEAVDDLVALDGRLQDYLEGVPAIGEQLMLRAELNSERAALNVEKLSLAAGVSHGSANGVANIAIEQMHTGKEADAGSPDPSWPGLSTQEVEEPRRSRWRLAIVPLLLLVLASAAYFVLQPDVAAWLAAIAGGVK